MNEQFKELALKCGAWHQVYGQKLFMHDHNFDIEKFGRLIVQECADVCDRFQARDVGMQPAECAGAIRKMFGVEE
jgi:hypothetical protein